MKKLMFLLILVMFACSEKSPQTFLGPRANFTDSGLEYIYLKTGDGPATQSEYEIITHCVLKVGDTTEIWNTRERGEPYSFIYTNTGQIEGFIETLGFMREGDQVKVIIPPEMGYGNQSFGDVPANAYLSFDIEVLKVSDPMLWIADSLFEAVKVGGKSSAMVEYERMKRDSSKYNLNERQLLILTSKLKNDGRLNDYFDFARIRAAEYPMSFGAHFNLGTIYADRGDKQSALNEYRICLEIDPKNPAAISKVNDLE